MTKVPGIDGGAGYRDRRLKATDEVLGFGFLIGAVSRLHTNCLDRVLKPMGLTHAQSTLLLMLANVGEGLSQTEIAIALDLGKSTVVGMVDRLEAKSYVYRLLTSSDRRLKRVVITEKGKEAVATIRDTVDTINSLIFPPQLRQQMASSEDYLQRIRRRLIDMGPAPES